MFTVYDRWFLQRIKLFAALLVAELDYFVHFISCWIRLFKKLYSNWDRQYQLLCTSKVDNARIHILRFYGQPTVCFQKNEMVSSISKEYQYKFSNNFGNSIVKPRMFHIKNYFFKNKLKKDERCFVSDIQDEKLFKFVQNNS